MTDPIGKNPVAHVCLPGSPPRILATDYVELKCFAAELRDKADLFDFACAIASPGPARDWWEGYPDSSLPHGGRSPLSHEEAGEFLKFTRGEAIKAGVWNPL